MNAQISLANFTCITVAALCLRAACVHAHPGHGEPEAFDAAPPESAFFVAQAQFAAVPAAPSSSEKKANRVTITTEGDYRVIRSNGWPDHAPGAFPRRGNPNTASPQNYTFRVPLKPAIATTPARGGGWWFAVALNGVPFEPGTAENWNNDPRSGWRYEAKGGFLDLGLDEHNAHVQPTGAYHYHGLPTGLIARLGGDGKKMRLIGWAADGFPLYTSFGYSDAMNAQSPLRKMKSSWRLKAGARPQSAGGPGGNYDGRFTQDFEFVKGSGDLDECNGRFGVTPEFPQGAYHYYVVDEFPFIARTWRGTPDQSFAKMGGPGGPGRMPGGPPRGILQDGGAGPFGGFGGEPERGGPPPPPLMRALDLNGDGVLDESEIAAADSLRKLDKNGDGKLTPDELRPNVPFGAGPPPGANARR
ncbi:MAG TPA: YHYH protein [Chthoniobacteraceae bacterium]|nr:YHYH protein [Chthoniobacteraceae bacterium]